MDTQIELKGEDSLGLVIRYTDRDYGDVCYNLLSLKLEWQAIAFQAIYFN